MSDIDHDEARADRRFGRIVLFFLSAGFFAVLLAGVAAGFVMLRSQEQTAWILHTYEVERHASAIRLSLEEMRSARRGMMIGLRGGSGATYDEAKASLFREVEEVARLTRDNPVQQRSIAGLRTVAQRLDRLFLASIRAGTVRDPIAEQARQSAAEAVEAVTDDILREERRLLSTREADLRNSVTIFYVVLCLAAGLLALVGVGSLWVIRRYTRDLTVSRDTLRLLNEDLEGAVRERTTDLQRANDEIQRFAYIVSHDLRSPLVNVMGFTAELEATIKPLAALIEQAESQAPEIVSNEARLAVREDLPESIGFIRTSTQKMDRLINAILRLSREGRRTITPEAIDLGTITQGVIDGLRHKIDELGIEVEVARDMPSITSDRLAIEQILSNLVENAVKYRKPGRPGFIRIGAYRQQGRVLVEVADNGRGIEKRDHERVFDLFRRSGQQDQPGEGIGLAHVRALAYRLGGTIGVASEIDKGATFTVNLPAAFAGDKGSMA